MSKPIGNLENHIIEMGWEDGVCPMCLEELESGKEVERLNKLLDLVNDHSETCAIFVYNSKNCNCFYGEIQKQRIR